MEKRSLTMIALQDALDLLDNDMSLYMILVDAFLKDTVFQAEKMRELEAEFRNSGSTESLEAAQYIHRLKGAARQLGANKLAAEAQKLEDIFRDKATGDTAALVETVLDLHKKTLAELASLED